MTRHHVDYLHVPTGYYAACLLDGCGWQDTARHPTEIAAYLNGIRHCDTANLADERAADEALARDASGLRAEQRRAWIISSAFLHLVLEGSDES